MSPMKVTDGTPPTQQWVPQTEPLNLDEPLGYHYVHEAQGQDIDVHLEDLDASVQHRIESWPGAIRLLRENCTRNYGHPLEGEGTYCTLCDEHTGLTSKFGTVDYSKQTHKPDCFLAANATEEST